MEELIYGIGKQDFRTLRQRGMIYVDKTSYIPPLIKGGSCYFMARPRRFGKSLFISTLKCFFEGEKDLFKGLAVETYDWDWAKYPVIHIDLNGADYTVPSSLDTRLNSILSDYEKKWDIVKSSGEAPDRFNNIIQQASEKFCKKVVILVDEYEKPILDSPTTDGMRSTFKNALRGLYSVMKNQEENIEIAFITGVTRFGQMSIFSGLNNLDDISLNDEFSALCGITQQELEDNFHTSIEQLSSYYSKSYDETLAMLKENYDGYHFSPDCPDIYNPMSVLKAFKEKRIRNYWWRTGTPKFLVDQLQKMKFLLPKFDNLWMEDTDLMQLNEEMTKTVPLLYQSGYLTIKEYTPAGNVCRIDFPNKEVRDSFFKYITPFYTGVQEEDRHSTIMKMLEFLREGDVDNLMIELQTFFAGHGYSLKGSFNMEEHFQNVMYIIVKLLEDSVETEYRTARGRIDMLIKSRDFIYIMEFKTDSSAEEALRQIESKQYSLPFKNDGRKVIKIGVNFSSEQRTISEWKADE